MTTRSNSKIRSDAYQPRPLPWIGDQDWREQAACSGIPYREFDPWYPEASDAAVSRAVRVCEGCTVREACLESAMVTGEIHGIWGGLTANQRRTLRRERQAIEAAA